MSGFQIENRTLIPHHISDVRVPIMPSLHKFGRVNFFNSSDRSRGDGLVNLAIKWCVPHHIRDDKPDAALLHRLADRETVLSRQRHRFLYQHRLAQFGTRNDEIAALLIRCRNHQTIDCRSRIRVFKQRLPVLKQGYAGKEFRICCLDSRGSTPTIQIHRNV